MRVQAVNFRWFHKPTEISPPHGSHAAAYIAGDASNAETMAVREYPYRTEQADTFRFARSLPVLSFI